MQRESPTCKIKLWFISRVSTDQLCRAKCLPSNVFYRIYCRLGEKKYLVIAQGAVSAAYYYGLKWLGPSSGLVFALQFHVAGILFHWNHNMSKQLRLPTKQMNALRSGLLYSGMLQMKIYLLNDPIKSKTIRINLLYSTDLSNLE